MKKSFFVTACLILFINCLTIAQGKLSIDKVYSVYLQNSGSIMENNEIKGYYFLYQSDKIDKKTNEYTLQILDQNLNAVKDIKFEDSKKISLLEASYNGKTLAFLFKNSEDKTMELRVYDMNGKLKYTYSNEYTKKTEQLMQQYATMHTDEGTNKNVFNVSDQGYVSVIPLRDGKQRTYEVNFYSSENRKQWTYTPGDEEKFAMAEYLGSNDSLIVLEVLKKSRLLSSDFTAHMVGISPITKKKLFEIEDSDDQYKFLPTSVSALKDNSGLIVMGSYFNKKDNVIKDFSKGLAVYTIDNNGKILSKTFNSWVDDFAKFLPLSKKGKINDVGFLYMHKLIQTPDKIFVVGEGYKREASAGGIALKALAMAGGSSGGNISVTKIVVTDLVVMEFDKNFKLVNANIYDKSNNSVETFTGGGGDFASQHMLAVMVKMLGGFDYEFTTGETDYSNFTICYSDYQKSAEYKGMTFNALNYNGTKFTSDKIELKSKASRMRVYPAKAGSVMILEYFKKAKKIELRLEKLG